MPTTTPTILDQISAEKSKVSERLARLETERATVATRLTDLETAERVLTRVSKTPPTRRTKSAAAAEAKAPTASRGRGRPPRAGASKLRDANPAHRASVSASWLWLPAGPDRNFTWPAPTIARTISASRCSATSAPDESRSVTASCTRHRPRHTRPPERELSDGREHVQLRPKRRRRNAGAFDKRAQFGSARSGEPGRRGRDPCQQRYSRG